MDRRVKQLRNKGISSVKVIWTHHGALEATWETEDEMRQRYPYLFQRYVQHKFRGRKFLYGGKGECNTPTFNFIYLVLILLLVI